MGKQRIVLKVSMDSAKRRSKALKIAVGMPGVISAALEGEEMERIVVVGEGVDSVTLTVMLRKQMGFAELVIVASTDEEKEEKKAKGGGEAESMLQPPVWPPYYMHEMQQNNSYDPSCCIM